MSPARLLAMLLLVLGCSVPRAVAQPADVPQADASPKVLWITREVKAPRVAFHTFDSTAAKGKVSYHLYTPAAYDAAENKDRRFPVVYWLHGSGGGAAGIAKVAAHFDAAIEAGKTSPCLVVFVNGLVEGMYVDWKDGTAPLESVIVKDLVPHIDGAYRTIATREGRMLDGFSMGGYGSARLGFKYPEMFRAVSIVGAGPMQAELIQAPRAGRQRAAEVLAKVYGGDQEYFRSVSPRRLAEQNAAAITKGSLVRMVIGDKDETFVPNKEFHEHLERLKIPHTWTVLPDVAHDPMGVLSVMGDDNWAFYRAAFGPKEPDPTPLRGRDQGNRRGLLAEMTAFKTDVPAHPFDIVLVRPTRDSMTVSVVCYEKDACEGYVEYRRDDSAQLDRCATQPLPTGVAVQFKMDRLTPDTAYVYRFKHRTVPARNAPGGKPEPQEPEAFSSSEYYQFHTPRAAGEAFTFTIQADSHLDANVTPAVYLQTLANALADKPDFHVDLGDTFMTDKRGREFKDTLPQYIAQRYYFGQLCHSAPLFMVLGNHDGEVGYANDGPSSMGPWSFAERTKYFPAPQIEDNADAKAMYSGRTSYAMGQGANYYELTWGDAQLIVLDPFWFTTAKPRGGSGGGGPGGGRDKKDADVAGTDENWARTLGKDQYDWLTRTLESSKAKYTFVFIHHLVGGLGKANRGGVESSVFFEWGGKNADGSDGFAEHRPGWAMPIHDLLVKHNVSVVFHGHDHLFVRSERDGLVYQCVPQPGNVAGGTRSAAEYGYKSGAIFGSPGYLRVRVSAEKAAVEFIRSAVVNVDDAGNRRADRRDAEVNGTVMHRYSIEPPIGK